MTYAPLRDALLNQMGGAAVAAELNALNELVAAEARRARRLTIWTVVVWCLWLALLFSYPLLRRPAPPAPGSVSTLATTQPSGAGVAPGTEYGFLPSALEVLAGTLIFVAFVGLPLVGIVLLILMILARRAASMGQVRASLASIDAQLRLLVAQQQQRPPAAPGPPG